jgi:L-2-hydroxyglutarate oxidase LhgO
MGQVEIVWRLLLVVGAGVIGLAVARALARARREVIVVERESGIGAGVSSRNSEVIHVSIYYPPGLDKTWLCGTARPARTVYRSMSTHRMAPTGRRAFAPS